MKNYSINSYNRLQKDIKQTTERISEALEDFNLCQDDLIVKYMPMTEHIARKFSTSQTASGVLDILDLMQYGYLGLIKAVNKLDERILAESSDPVKTIKAFLSKRIKGAIRRAINIHRGDMKIPEYKLNELRGLELEEHEYDPRVALFFSQVFQSTDEYQVETANGFNPFDKADESEPYNIDVLNKYLLGIMRKYLTEQQYHVLRLSFGLDTVKMSAVDIASWLGMNMVTANVRVSQIKREAINILIQKTDPTEVFDI